MERPGINYNKLEQAGASQEQLQTGGIRAKSPSLWATIDIDKNLMALDSI